MSGLEVGTISSASNSSNWVPSSTTSKDDGINPEYEALLGVSVKSAKVLPSRLTTRLGTFKKVEISEVNATLTGQWYTVGVVVSKSQVKTAKTDAGSKFGVLTLYDMKKTTIALFCFGEAFQTFMDESVGSVLVVGSASIKQEAHAPTVSNRGHKRQGLMLSVTSSTQIIVVGMSGDLVQCEGYNKDSSGHRMPTRCQEMINGRISKTCTAHALSAYYSLRDSRQELNRGISSTVDAHFLRSATNQQGTQGNQYTNQATSSTSMPASKLTPNSTIYTTAGPIRPSIPSVSGSATSSLDASQNKIGVISTITNRSTGSYEVGLGKKRGMIVTTEAENKAGPLVGRSQSLNQGHPIHSIPADLAVHAMPSSFLHNKGLGSSAQLQKHSAPSRPSVYSQSPSTPTTSQSTSSSTSSSLSTSSHSVAPSLYARRPQSSSSTPLPSTGTTTTTGSDTNNRSLSPSVAPTPRTSSSDHVEKALYEAATSGGPSLSGQLHNEKRNSKLNEQLGFTAKGSKDKSGEKGGKGSMKKEKKLDLYEMAFGNASAKPTQPGSEGIQGKQEGQVKDTLHQNRPTPGMPVRGSLGTTIHGYSLPVGLAASSSSSSSAMSSSSSATMRTTVSSVSLGRVITNTINPPPNTSIPSTTSVPTPSLYARSASTSSTSSSSSSSTPRSSSMSSSSSLSSPLPHHPPTVQTASSRSAMLLSAAHSTTTSDHLRRSLSSSSSSSTVTPLTTTTLSTTSTSTTIPPMDRPWVSNREMARRVDLSDAVSTRLNPSARVAVRGDIDVGKEKVSYGYVGEDGYGEDDFTDYRGIGGRESESAVTPSRSTARSRSSLGSSIGSSVDESGEKADMDRAEDEEGESVEGMVEGQPRGGRRFQIPESKREEVQQKMRSLSEINKGTVEAGLTTKSLYGQGGLYKPKSAPASTTNASGIQNATTTTTSQEEEGKRLNVPSTQTLMTQVEASMTMMEQNRLAAGALASERVKSIEERNRQIASQLLKGGQQNTLQCHEQSGSRAMMNLEGEEEGNEEEGVKIGEKRKVCEGRHAINDENNNNTENMGQSEGHVDKRPRVMTSATSLRKEVSLQSKTSSYYLKKFGSQIMSLSQGQNNDDTPLKSIGGVSSVTNDAELAKLIGVTIPQSNKRTTVSGQSSSPSSSTSSSSSSNNPFGEELSAEDKALLAKGSRYQKALEEAKMEQTIQMIDRHVQLEKLEDQLRTVTTKEGKAFWCTMATCPNYKVERQYPSSACKANGHRIEMRGAMVRYFACRGCGQRESTFKLIPTSHCEKCGKLDWEQTSVTKLARDTGPKERLLIRGEKENPFIKYDDDD